MTRYILAALCLSLLSCDLPDEPSPKKSPPTPSKVEMTLTAAGFREIKEEGFAFFSCSSDDTYGVHFTATNPMGARVSGVVCCGLVFKGCTVRF